jgi:hypothetical protein
MTYAYYLLRGPKLSKIIASSVLPHSLNLTNTPTLNYCYKP